MFTRRQLTHLKKLRAEEDAARSKRLAYQEKILAGCDHSMTLYESWGGEDTLGNYNPHYVTHAWHCALCGKRLASESGVLGDLPADHPEKRKVSLPYGLKESIRKRLISGAPQTPEDVLDLIRESGA